MYNSNYYSSNYYSAGYYNQLRFRYAITKVVLSGGTDIEVDLIKRVYLNTTVSATGTINVVSDKVFTDPEDAVLTYYHYNDTTIKYEHTMDATIEYSFMDDSTIVYGG